MIGYIPILLLCTLSGGGLLPPFTGLSTTKKTILLVAASDPTATASVTIDASGGISNEADEVEENHDDPEDDDSEEDDDDDDDDDDDEYGEFATDYAFEYYPSDFEFGEGGTGKRRGGTKILSMGMFILNDYVVAGSNLASYKVTHPKYQLFEDFDIGSMVKGNEMWMEMVGYRNIIERPTLSWYVDKVARKRWLGERGYPQPTIYYMKYKDEIVPDNPSSTKEEDAAVILQNLPTMHGYAAKPTHMSLLMGSWLVDIDPNRTDTTDGGDGNVRFTVTGKQLKSDVKFNPAECAASLADGVQQGPDMIESWALKMVHPGLVIEELYSDHLDRSHPPNEFGLFVVWGRVYCGVWNNIDGDNRWASGIFYRDGTLVPGSAGEGRTLPDWAPWEHLVSIAESLGRNKDMIRIDMFVGVPRYSPPNTPPQVVVSESELHPTTVFANPYVADEMARLWVAGYKIGNYKTIPNKEVPKDFRVKATKAIMYPAEDTFEYYGSDFEYAEDGTGIRRGGDERILSMGMFILSDFVVAGSNLASYNVIHPKYQLFEDFDIGSMVKGNEMWMDMVGYRNIIKHPTLSWYVDKVARKRWLGERGYPQPNIYYMKYKDEIVPDNPSSTKEEDAAVILQNLPTTHGYAAKPTHMSLSMGSWLVDIDPNRTDTTDGGDGDVCFTQKGKQLKSDVKFDPAECADSLAEGVQRGPARIESWALRMVRPGLVIEELYSNHLDRSHPPNEFGLFVVWGRVYCGVWNSNYDDGRWVSGIFYRDGSLVPESAVHETTLPDWVPWKHLVSIAESLGQNKDMIRIDMFVGVPRYSPPDTPPQIVVSESEIHPTTVFASPYIADEMARLWVAGYKIGNYETIPNKEVPKDFRSKAT